MEHKRNEGYVIVSNIVPAKHNPHYLIFLLLLPGKGRNSMNECLCPVIKNSAGPREQMSLLCYIKVYWNIYNAKTMHTALVTSMRRGVPAGSEFYP